MKSTIIRFLVLLLFGFLILFLGLILGTIEIPIRDLFHLTPEQSLILFHVRLPRLCNAFLVGASLASAGAVFQGILQNPLADPYILGVSAGAGLGAAASILLGLVSISAFFLPVGAFVGAFATILLVYILVSATKQFHVTHFILVGIMINAFFSAITLLMVYLLEKRIFGLMFWLMGDLSKTTLPYVLGSALFIVPLLLLILYFAYPINIISLGDEQAQSLGVNVYWVRTAVFFLSSMLIAFAVAGGGIIGFLGLIIPHLMRFFIKDDFRLLIPFSFLMGGIFLMGADTLARTIIAPSELPVGIITSFIGAPFFIWLMINRLRIKP